MIKARAGLPPATSLSGPTVNDMAAHLAAHAVTRLENDRFSSNAYIATCGNHALVIDPADEGSGRITAFLCDQGISDVLIILTHEHFDHMSGITRLREEFIGTKLVCSRFCSDHITRPTGNFSRYLTGVDVVCSAADSLCEDINYEILWANTRVKMIPTPGHSPGSICIVLDDILFSGDTLIRNLATVTRLPGGRHDQLKASIARLVDCLQPTTVVFPGHGEPFLLAEIDQEVVLGVVRPRDEGVRSHLRNL